MGPLVYPRGDISAWLCEHEGKRVEQLNSETALLRVGREPFLLDIEGNNMSSGATTFDTVCGRFWCQAVTSPQSVLDVSLKTCLELQIGHSG
jgi:hypothetical protein